MGERSHSLLNGIALSQLRVSCMVRLVKKAPFHYTIYKLCHVWKPIGLSHKVQSFDYSEMAHGLVNLLCNERSLTYIRYTPKPSLGPVT